MMGAFLSSDLKQDVRKTVSTSRSRLEKIHDDMLDRPDDDCNIGITDKLTVNRYKDVDVKGSQIMPILEIEPKTKIEICKTIKAQQRRKEKLIDFIIVKLEEYNDVVEWLTDGRYCAFNTKLQVVPATVDIQSSRDKNSAYHFKIMRKDDAGVEFNRSSCHGKGGKFVDYFPAGTMNQPASEDQKSYYELDVPENREWKELVDNFVSAFTSAWRHLRRSLDHLMVRQFLKSVVMDREEAKIRKILAELDGELQFFLEQVLVKERRPRSKLDVYQAQLQHNKNIAKIVEQEHAAERIARKEYKKMRDTAKAIHDAPGAGSQLAYEINHAETS